MAQTKRTKVTATAKTTKAAKAVKAKSKPDPALLDGRVLEKAEQVLGAVEPFTTEMIEQALRALSEQLGLKPREAFQPIRVAVTGSKVSPGLFESIELLGRDATLERIRRAQAVRLN